jgi:hypothetical protein
MISEGPAPRQTTPTSLHYTMMGAQRSLDAAFNSPNVRNDNSGGGASALRRHMVAPAGSRAAHPPGAALFAAGSEPRPRSAPVNNVAMSTGVVVVPSIRRGLTRRTDDYTTGEVVPPCKRARHTEHMIQKGAARVALTDRFSTDHQEATVKHHYLRALYEAHKKMFTGYEQGPAPTIEVIMAFAKTLLVNESYTLSSVENLDHRNEIKSDEILDHVLTGELAAADQAVTVADLKAFISRFKKQHKDGKDLVKELYDQLEMTTERFRDFNLEWNENKLDLTTELTDVTKELVKVKKVNIEVTKELHATKKANSDLANELVVVNKKNVELQEDKEQHILLAAELCALKEKNAGMEEMLSLRTSAMMKLLVATEIPGCEDCFSLLGDNKKIYATTCGRLMCTDCSAKYMVCPSDSCAPKCKLPYVYLQDDYLDKIKTIRKHVMDTYSEDVISFYQLAPLPTFLQTYLDEAHKQRLVQSAAFPVIISRD